MTKTYKVALNERAMGYYDVYANAAEKFVGMLMACPFGNEFRVVRDGFGLVATIDGKDYTLVLQEMQ